MGPWELRVSRRVVLKAVPTPGWPVDHEDSSDPERVFSESPPPCFCPWVDASCHLHSYVCCPFLIVNYLQHRHTLKNNTIKWMCGVEFGIVDKPWVEMAAYRIEVPGSSPGSASDSNFLLLCALGGSRWMLQPWRAYGPVRHHRQFPFPGLGLDCYRQLGSESVDAKPLVCPFAFQIKCSLNK